MCSYIITKHDMMNFLRWTFSKSVYVLFECLHHELLVFTIISLRLSDWLVVFISTPRASCSHFHSTGYLLG